MLDMTNKKPPGRQLPDLSDASLEELEAQQEHLNRFIERRLKAKKQEALDQIKRLTEEYELSFDEVVAVVRTTTKRGKAPAVYRNPEKPRQTWSGKGEPPDWFKDHQDPESLRIPGA